MKIKEELLTCADSLHQYDKLLEWWNKYINVVGSTYVVSRIQIDRYHNSKDLALMDYSLRRLYQSVAEELMKQRIGDLESEAFNGGQRFFLTIAFLAEKPTPSATEVE